MKRIIIYLLVLVVSSMSLVFAVSPDEPSVISDGTVYITEASLTASVDLGSLVKDGIALGFSESALNDSNYQTYDGAKSDICNSFVLGVVMSDTIHAASTSPYYLRYKLYSKDNLNIYLKAKAPMVASDASGAQLNWKVSAVTDSQYSGGVASDTVSTEYDKKIKVASYTAGIGVSGSFGFEVETENLINKPIGKTYEGVIVAEVIAE